MCQTYSRSFHNHSLKMYTIATVTFYFFLIAYLKMLWRRSTQQYLHYWCTGNTAVIHWIRYQESHIQQWFSNDSRELQSREWKLVPNPLMSARTMVIHNHGKLCTTVTVFSYSVLCTETDFYVSVIVTIYMVVKSYIEANNANVEIINSYTR